MAAKKRKPTRTTAKKVVKKTAAKAKKPVAKKVAAKKPAAKRAVAKKPAAKRVVAKKAPAKKAVAKPAPIKLEKVPSKIDKAMTKGQLLTTLAGTTGMARKEISSMLDSLTDIIAVHMKKQGPGQFTLPGLAKITVKHKPATKARKGVNPFTGEEMMFKAKPSRNVVKVRPLQRLKEMV